MMTEDMNMDEERIVISRNLQEDLVLALSECEHDRLFVLTDTNTTEHCWPLIKDFLCLKQAELLTIAAGDEHKTIDTANEVWQQLSQQGATRHSCLINLGGGMVTDLGGFVAGTFKRGINYINMPTSLLAMVDASTGGKTGVNLNGLKNEIGVFNHPSFVIIHTPFLQTLDHQNFLSGYAEMLKHGLIDSESLWAETLQLELTERSTERIELLLLRNIEVKRRIVAADPKEQGLRKALNVGHTIGHALETFTNYHTEDGLLHGYAIAFGLIGELYLSAIKCGFPTDRLRQTVHFIRENYGQPSFSCNDYDELLSLMQHDKKNISGIIHFTLLGDIGKVRLNQTATELEIKEALDFIREG